MEVGVLEHLGENVLGQDVLDQHFLDVVLADRRIDRIAGVGQEVILRPGELARLRALHLDDPAQFLQHGGQIGGELLHRLVEVGHFLALVREEAGQQREQRVDIGHRRASYFVAILIENGGGGIFKDDIVFGVPFAKLGSDLFLQIIRLVLRFPITERHPQAVQQRAVQINAVTLVGDAIIFGNELQIVRFTPALEQILERLTQHAFALAAGDRFHPVQLGAVCVDQLTAQCDAPLPRHRQSSHAWQGALAPIPPRL